MRFFSFIFSCFIIVNLIDGQVVPPHPDNSVSTEAYIKMGLPSTNKAWGLEEYEKAFKVLDKIFEMDKYSIPRYKSTSSAVLFDRLVSFENFDYLINPNVDISERVKALSDYAYFPAKLQFVYSEPGADSERFGFELVESMLLNVHFAKNALVVINELKTVLGDKGNKTELDKAIKEIERGMLNGVDDLLKILELENKRFDKKVVEHLASRWSSFLPDIWNQIATGQQTKIKERVKLISKNSPYKSLAASMKKLSKQMKKK